jgi:hypothetical protein
MDVEYPLPHVFGNLPFTYDCPHHSYLPLTHNFSPSLSLTKRDMEIQSFPYKSQLEPPSKALFLDDLTSKVNRLTLSYDYIGILTFGWEEVCGDMDQPWYNLGLVFHRYYLTLFLDLGMTKIFPDSHLMLNISLVWMITKHKGKSRVVDELIKWLH